MSEGWSRAKRNIGKRHQGNSNPPAIHEVTDVSDAHCRVSEQFLMSIAAGVCPHCQTAIEQVEQVGWCIYARPCGCRLMQGRISDGEGEVKS